MKNYTIINLTLHPVSFYTDGGAYAVLVEPASEESSDRPMHSTDSVNTGVSVPVQGGSSVKVFKHKSGVVNLPPPQEGVLYLVFRSVLDFCDRPDLIALGSSDHVGSPCNYLVSNNPDLLL